MPTLDQPAAAPAPLEAEDASADRKPKPAAAKLPPPIPRARTRTSQAPGKPRAVRHGDLDVAALAELDKTKENRGAVGVKHDSSGSLTANAASGTIGDTPPPLVELSALASGASTAAPVVARGTPAPSAIADRLPLPPDLPQPPELPPPPSVLTSPPSLLTSPPRVAPDAAPGQLAVPLGEFDHGETILEQDKLRIAYAQATIVRDPANALLGVAEAAPAPVATDDADRGDPTEGDRGEATAISAPSSRHAPAGTLRSVAALPRKRGIAGDMRYVATVVLGSRAARRELAELAARQATRQKARRHHLVTLGRAAVTAEGLEHRALGPAREQLAAVEDERSQHAGHVVAADAELARVRRDREAKARQYAVDLAALDSELTGLARKLEPLDKSVARIKKHAADLQESLRRIDGKIAATEASLSSTKGRLDRAAVQAELATLKADRKAIQRDEPVLAGELDALSPRIAALEAARAEAERKRAELVSAEQDDQRRVEELLAAIGAKRKVVDRAAADAEALRDKILFQLGEQLYVDRPGDLAPQLAPIDEIDVELGVADRRMMELREILSSVDKGKVARGIALLTLITGAIAALTIWLIWGVEIAG